MLPNLAVRSQEEGGGSRLREARPSKKPVPRRNQEIDAAGCISEQVAQGSQVANRIAPDEVPKDLSRRGGPPSPPHRVVRTLIPSIGGRAHSRAWARAPLSRYD